MLGSQNHMRAAEATPNGSLIANAAWLFLEQDAHSLAVATATGLGAYFIADLCLHNADDIYLSIEDDTSIGTLKKTSHRTLAFLLKAANITGKTYALAAIGSLPIRYVIPILGEENITNALKNIAFHFVFHANNNSF